MFMINEAEATLIREAYERGGEAAAAAELCRIFPGLTDQIQARQSARTIAGWRPHALRSANENHRRWGATPD